MNIQNNNFKSIDSANYQVIKPLIDLFYISLNDNLLTNNDKLNFKRLKLENPIIYDMLRTFRGLMEISNQPLETMNETVYLLFRKIYINFNEKQEALKSNNQNTILNTKSFPNIENIITHLAYLNNKFKDTESLNYNQYYKLYEVEEFVNKTKKMLESSNHPKFKEELKELKVLAPFITQYIKILENNVNRFLEKVNKSCNDTQMTKELFNDYKYNCATLNTNLNKLKIDFNIENVTPKKDVSTSLNERPSEHKFKDIRDR